MEVKTMTETGAVLKNPMPDPSEVEVVNGTSWQCPVYVRKAPPCKTSCPSSEDIRGYLTYIAQADENKRGHEESTDEAWYTLTDKNPFPATHGRICPHPCESGCNRQYKEDGAVAINNMERYIGDHGLKRGLKLRKITDKVQTKKVAVIGGGPSGLSCAYQMARRGYPVTVFEAAEKPGGMLRYGIPSYRLPEEVLDAETQNILDLGVELKCGVKIGEDVSFDQLNSDYDVVYVAVGAQKGSPMKIEGEDSARVLSGVDFLRRINSGESVDVGKKVVVVGGGNTAVDAARVSKRLGADVTIIYRRTRHEMPAIEHEITACDQEGIEIVELAAPTAAADSDGALSVTCIKMQLGEKDKSGRARPEPIEGSEYEVQCDTLIAAVGQQPDLAGMDAIANQWGWIDDKATRVTPVEGVYAGGDVVNLDIATTAVGHGRRAAQVMDAWLHDVEVKEFPRIRPVSKDDMRLEYYAAAPRNEEVELAVADRITHFSEINSTLTEEQAVAEASRCMSCGLCFNCDQCRVYCPMEAISRDKKRPVGQVMFTDYTKCIGCHICAQACPCGYIEMGMGL